MKINLALILVFVVCEEGILGHTQLDSVTQSKQNATRRSDDLRYPNGDSQASGNYDASGNQYPTEAKQIFSNQGYGDSVLGYDRLSLINGLRSVSPGQLPHQALNPSYSIQNKDHESQGSAVVYSDDPRTGSNGPVANYDSGRYFNIGQAGPLKTHDSIKKKYSKGGGGNPYGGGWDVQASGFNSAGPWFDGGSNYQGGGSGLAGAAGLLAVKKAAGAKALFVLIVPLILLAVFGPILAGQAMIPWILSGGGGGIGGVGGVGGVGGLNTVATTVGGRGRRSVSSHLPENSSLDPRQIAELEKRLRVFMAVQEYIAQTGSEYSFQDDISAAYMKCQGYLEENNQCIERVACEYADKKSAMNGIERRITAMVLQNIMSNSNLPASMKGRLSKGAMFGRTHPSRCATYFCEIVDGKRRRSQNQKL